MKRLINKSKRVLELQFIRYLIIGGISFIIDFTLFNFFVFGLSIEPLPANMTSIAISVLFNFIMSNYWTFKAGGNSKRKKIVKYLSIIALNYLINNTILYLLITYTSLHVAVIKIMVTILQISWTFMLYKVWVFKIKD